MKQQLAIAAAMGMAFAAPAFADTILAFGQDGTARTVSGAAVTTDCSTILGPLCRTEISATSVAITVTAIGPGGGVTPLAGFLNLDVTASSPLLQAGPALFQEFEGSFSITSGTGGTGVNFLSASFVDLVAGLSGASALSLTASNPPDPLVFTSDVLDVANFVQPLALSFSFTDLSSPAAACGGVIKTLCDFSSNVSGNMSATVAAVPEPTSLSLAGAGLLGLAGLFRRRRLSA